MAYVPYAQEGDEYAVHDAAAFSDCRRSVWIETVPNITYIGTRLTVRVIDDAENCMFGKPRLRLYAKAINML